MREPAPVPASPAPRRVPTGLGRGLVAAATWLLAGFGVRLALGVPHPAELAADWITLIIPPGAFDLALGLLGRVAKPLLFLVALALLGLAMALPGLWHARRGWGVPGGLGLGLLTWLVQELALLPIFGAGAFGLLLPVGGARAAGGALAARLLYGPVLGRLARRPAPAGARPPSPSRRRLLLAGGGALLGLALAVWLDARRRAGGLGAALPRDADGVLLGARRPPG